MNKNSKIKIIIASLVFIMALVNIVLFNVYATDENDTQVPNTKVYFDAYFKANNQNLYEIQKNINSEKMKLYISLKVDEGYLKASEISLGESNFNLVETEINSDIIESIDFNNNKFTIKQLSKGENIELELPIKFKKDTKFDINNFNKKSKILLNGTYVNNKAVEIQNIAREVAVYPHEEDIELNLKSNITKYIKTEKNIILEEEITSNIVNNLLPVEETVLKLNAPEINGVKPEAYVYVDSSKATNGKLNTEINGIENVYTYDKEENLVTIKLENKADETGIVSWEKNAQDKVTVTYIYGQSAISDETVKIENKISSTVKAYNYPKEIEKTETIDETKELEIKGTEISINVVAPGSLNKGYLYGEEEKIEYKENYSVDVSNINQEALEIASKDSKFINDDETEQEVESYYTQTVISKDNFINILGEDGTIQILDENSNVLGTINKNNKFIIKYNKQVKNISIKTSAPIKLGKLEIENTKYIINTKLTKENIEKIKKLKDSAIVKTSKTEFTSGWFVNFEEPTTKVSSSIENKTLSTLAENKNVKFQIELKTQNGDDKLFTNPEIKIQLPSYVQRAKINQINKLFGEEYKISTNYSTETKILTINLEGTQTKHKSSNTVLEIYADILLDKTTSSKTDIIKVTTTNDNDEVQNNISIKVKSKDGLLIINNIKDANTQKDIVNSTDNEITVAGLPVNSSEREITITKTIVNNYGENVNNLEFIEKFLNSENTFNTYLASQVTTNIGKVFYLTDNVENWVESVEDYSKVTAFKISDVVIEKDNKMELEYKLKIPENIKYDSQSTINDNITCKIGEKSQNKQTVIKLYSEKKEINQETADTIKNDEIRYEKQYEKVKVKVGLTSGGNPVKESDQVKEGQYLRYTVEITNTSSEVLRDVNLKSTLENANLYTLDRTGHMFDWKTEKEYDETGVDFGLRTYEEVDKADETEIDTIEPNQTKTYSFQAVVHEDAKDKEMCANIQVSMQEKNIDTIKISNKVVDAKLKLAVRYHLSDNMDASTKDAFGIVILAKNISDEDLKNVVISIELPDELKNSENNIYEDDKEECYFDDKKIEGNTIYYTLNELKVGQENKIILLMKSTIDEAIERVEVKLKANAKVDNEEYTSNEFIKTIYQASVNVTAKQEGSIKEDTVKTGDELTYTFTITNTEKESIDMLEFTDILPAGVRLEDIVLEQNNKETKYDVSSISFASISDILLEPNETIFIKLITTVNIKDITDDSNEITNYAIISNYNMEDVKTNGVTYKINPEEKSNSLNGTDNSENSGNGTNSDSQNDDKANTVSGIAWLDENENGARETIEQLLSDIRVILINEETKSEVQTALTSNEGTYKFENIPDGKYVIRFEYDNSSYTPTTYQKANVSYTLNSDVIETKDSSGNTITTTDTIEITNNNVRNMDIGLVRRTKFDLKLDKYISSITVQNKQGVKTYTYTDQKLAKIEIPAKYMDGSNVIIEYTIVITNEGDVPGFAKNIVDYIPSDMKFNSELNTNWYVMSDGYAYNTNLDELVINPGERIDTQLILTKTINGTDSELINNIAEIFEDYNTSGLEDIDSIAGNKKQDEDDISNAEVIISIKTGEILRNSLIATIIVVILAIGIYKIRKINSGKEKENE